MKVRDSGMPEADYWESLFNVPLILDRMGVDDTVETLVEVGCGYGTFTLPAARRLQTGRIHAFDIDGEMVLFTKQRLQESPAGNVDVVVTHADLLSDNSLKSESADYVMLFNILHHDRPEEFLELAYRWLRPGGRIGVIHWRYDETTPRGPKMEIRPRPEQLLAAAERCGFFVSGGAVIDLPPYHYGFIGIKNE